MGEGIHAEVEIGDPTACQVAAYPAPDEVVTAVDRASTPGDGSVTEEFTIEHDRRRPDGGASVDRPAVDAAPDPEIRSIFSDGDRTVYRFERDYQGCACEAIEAGGSVVRDVTAADGHLEVSFLAPDLSALQTVVGGLNDAYDEVYVRRLLRSARAETGADAVLVDRSVLTDRQREVLATAYRKGYFEHPRDTQAAAVATALGITTATFTEHLAAAQRKLLDELLGRAG